MLESSAEESKLYSFNNQMYSLYKLQLPSVEIYMDNFGTWSSFSKKEDPFPKKDMCF